MAPLLRTLLFTPLLQGALLAGGPALDGTILPFRQVDVGAAVPGRLAEVKVREGETVKAGQVLVQLHGRIEELEMQRAKALLERREFEAKGAKRLYDNRIIPEAKALESRIELELARIQYEVAAEQVRLRTVLAPMDGVVVAGAHEVGEAVAPGQPLFRILDLSRVLVQAGVEPALLGAFAPGRKVRVDLPQAPGIPPVEGTVVLVDPCADAEGRVRIRILVDNAEGRIRSGLKARVLLES